MQCLLKFYKYFKRLVGIPIFSIFTNKFGFTLFFKKNNNWKMYTRGVIIPIKEPRLSALEYYRYFVPQRGDTIFDVGGEKGLEAKQFSILVGNEGCVYTFECFPNHILTLKKLSKERKNIRVIEKACWNCKERLELFLGNTEGSNTAIPEARGQLGQDLANQKMTSFSVEADTLDNMWQQYANSTEIELLKMDIEGAEYEALEGAKKLLSSTKNAVIAAYHIRDGIPTAKKVSEVLISAGFNVIIGNNLHVYASKKNL